MDDLLAALNALGPTGLFWIAFVAATLLPVQSEAVLVGMVIAGGYPEATLVAAASAGNVAGAVVNWWLGGLLRRFEGRRWFPVKRESIQRVEAFYLRRGYWTLLLSWAPIIGDPLTVLVGFFREPLWRFVLIVGFAKTARYAVVAGLAGLG